MKKLFVFILAAIILIAFSSMVMAVPPGKNVEFDGKGAGKVIFSGDKHSKAGSKCADCHPKVFQMKKGTAKVKMADINAGKSCGTCHNGKKAFAAKDNCAKCHTK